MTDESIWIVTEVEPTQPDEASGAKGEIHKSAWAISSEPASNESASRSVKSVLISAEKLEGKMAKFLSTLGKVFQNAAKQANLTSGFCLDEIQVSVQITGSGEFKLWPTGATAGAKGTMTLKFKRKAD